jgi:hypothetical protein
MSVYRNYIYSIYMCNDKFHIATCFDSQRVIFRPFELNALTKRFIYNNCLVKAISSNGLNITHCESKHVAI